MTLVSGLFTTAFRICESAFPRKCSPRPQGRGDHQRQRQTQHLFRALRRHRFPRKMLDHWEHFEKKLGNILRNIGKNWEKLGKNIGKMGNMLGICWKRAGNKVGNYGTPPKVDMFDGWVQLIQTTLKLHFFVVFPAFSIKATGEQDATRIGIPNWTIFGSDPPDPNHHLWSLVGWGSHLPKQIFGQM